MKQKAVAVEDELEEDPKQLKVTESGLLEFKGIVSILRRLYDIS